MSRFLIFISLFISHFALAMSDDRDAQVSTNKIVEGIVSFSHWPNLTGQPLLCVSQKSIFFDFSKITQNQVFKVATITDKKDYLSSDCNAIYFGQESESEQAAVIKSLTGENILTISENNADCVAGAAFCINRHEKKFKFSVNLDSLSRSGVKVNSDVLLLSKDGDE